MAILNRPGVIDPSNISIPDSIDDYTSNPDPAAILKDPRFLQDLRDQYGNNLDDEELIDKFYADQTWGDLNTISALKDAAEATTAGSAERQRLNRLERAYRNLPWFWQEGGRGVWEAVKDAVPAILADPINFIPGVNAAAKARIAGRAAQAAGRSVTRAGIGAGAKAGAISEGAISAGQEAIVNTAQQTRDIQLGLQDEFSLGELGASTAFGGAIGGGVGGAIGAGVGGIAGRAGARDAQALTALGYSPEDVARMTPEQARAAMARNEGPQASAEGDAAAQGEREEEGADQAAETETPEQAIDREFANVDLLIENNVDAYRRELDNLRSSEADAEIIEEARKRLIAVRRLKGMVERLKRQRSEIDALGETNDIRSLNLRDRRLERFEDDFANLRQLIRENDAGENPDDILSRIQQMRDAPEEAADDAVADGDAPAGQQQADQPAEDAAVETSPEEAATPEPEQETEQPEVQYRDDTQRQQALDILSDAGLNENDLQLFIAAGRVNYGSRGKLTQRSMRELRGIARQVKAQRDQGAPAAPQTPETEAPATIETGEAPEAPAAPNISPELRGQALADGIDYRNLEAPAASKTGRVTKRVVNRAIRGRADSGQVDDYAAQAQEDLDSILNVIGVIDEDEALVREIIEIAARDPDAGLRTDPDDVLSLYDEIKRRADATDEGASNPSRESVDTTSKTFEQQVKRRARVLRQQNPELSDDAIQQIATGQVTREMADSAGVSAGDVRGTGRRTEEAGQLTTAGRTNTGRIQSFLKRGARIGKGSDYTVTGGYQVRPSEFGFEAALIKGQQSGGIQEFVLSGPMKVMTRDGVKTLKRGDVAFADPRTRRAYDSRDLALEVRGDGPPRSKNTASEADGTEASASAIRDLLDEYRESGDARGFLRAVSALRRGETVDTARANGEPEEIVDTATTPSGSIPLQRGDKLLIVRSKIDPNDVRMISPRQAANGGDITTIIGRKGNKANPENWEARYAPAEEYSASPAQRRQLFERLESADAGDPPQPGRITEAGNVTGIGRPLNPDELASVQLSELTEDEIKAFSAAGVSAESVAGGATLSDLAMATSRLESGKWGANKAFHQQTAKHLRVLYDLMSREAPQGYHLPNESRENSVKQVRQIFEHYSTEELEAASDLINRLGGDPTVGPRFTQEARGDNWSMTGNSTGVDQQINLQPGSTNFRPRLAVLYHEVAHWAYFNILTPQDRLDFWRSAERYYGQDGQLDRQAVDRAVGTPNSMQVTDDVRLTTNSMASAQELFAQQFEVWAMRNRAPAGIGSETFWRKVTRYVKAIFDRYYKDTAIDPDLEPLFARILPPEEADKVRLGVDAEPATDFGRNIQKRYVELQQLRRDLDDAFARDSADAIITAHGELVRYLLSIAPRGSTADRPNTGAFSPVRRIYKMIHQRIDDIDEIVEGKPFRYEDMPGGEVRVAPEWLDMGVMEVEDPQAVADLLRDHYNNGYAGEFKPAKGVPGEIRKMEATSVRNLLDMVNVALEGGYARAESGNMVAGYKPRLSEEDLAPANKPSSGVRKQKTKRQRRNKAADREARKTARTPASKRKSKVSTKADPSAAEELKSKNIDELRALYMKNRGTQRGDQIAQQMLEKEKAAPLPPKAVPITQEIRNLGGADLRQRLLRALDDSDSETIDMVSYEIRRRHTNKGLKRIGEPMIQPVFRVVNRSIEQEAADSIGVATSDGIPPSARASVREMLSYMTHRDPEVEYTLRTMTYRMLNLLGKANRGAIEDTNIMTTGDIARLAGVDPTNIGNAVFADMRAPEFRKLRRDMRRMAIGLSKGNVTPFDVMHEVGHVVARSGMLDSSELDAVREAYRLANDATKKRIQDKYGRKYQDRITANKDDLLAEEWFAESLAEYMGERVAKGDILQAAVDGEVGNLTLRGGFSRAIDRATEYVAYIINGMVGRNDIKQQFRRLFLFGDMHRKPRQSPISSALLDGPAVSPSIAADVAMDSVMGSPASRLQKIRNYIGDGLSYDADADQFVPFYHGTSRGYAFRQDTNPEAYMRVSTEGNFGPGVYLADNPEVASQVYARRPTTRALEEEIASLDIPQDQKTELVEDAAHLNYARRTLSRLRAEYSQAIQDGLAEDRASDIRAELDELVELEQALEGRLVEAGVEIDPMVLPLFTRVRNPADFRESAVFESLDDPMIRSILDHMNMTDSVTNRAYRNIETAFSAGALSGDDAYRALVRLYKDSGRSEVQAKTELNETLEDLGYDGLLATHRNTVDVESGPTMANSTTYEASRMAYDGLVVFDNRNIKHVTAAEFDAGDQRIYYREGAGLPRGEVGSLVDDIISESVESVESINAGSFGEAMETRGATPSLTDSLMSMIRGRRLNTKEEQAMRKQSPMWWLQSQSSRMRDLGAQWLGNWYKGHFPDIHSKFAAKYMPIHHALRALPDADGKVRAWAREASAGVGQKQPKSYSRIVRALRSGEGSRAEKALSTQEREIFQQIRTALANERQEMVNLGIHVGDRGPNYLPQTWNPEKIRKNREQFIAGMEQYYLIEKQGQGKTGTAEEARDFANGIYERLAGNEADGTYIPIRGGSRSTRFENVDYSRIIELEKYPEAMRMLEEFLEDDLESILVKYFEGSTRKLTQAQKFGVNNHGFYDYLMAAEQGPSGIARLLSNNKIFRRDFRAISEDGYVTEGTLTETAPMPFEGQQGEAEQFVQELVEVHRTKGSAAARQMLNDIAPRVEGGLQSNTYARRADAIIGALDDFDGRPSQFEQKDYSFLDSAMDVAMKKPIVGTGGEGVRNFSKFMRSFNNVSLLGFTTLTSLGDVVLPIIRSGSMKNWSKAMKEYARDPEYRRMLENVGVAMETIVHERMIYMYGAVDNKLSTAFFNATMLTPWTDMNRRIAGAVGYESLKAMQTKAFKSYQRGVPIGQQSRQYKTAARFLTRYGLADYLPSGQKAGESLSNRKLLENDELVRQAILRFADDSIFVPNPNDIPLWAQTPWGALIFQLKSFPLMMARLGRDSIKEFRQGNVKPLLYLATLGPAFGSGALAAKDIIQMRGGDDGKDAELRERSLNNILESMGYNANIHGSKDDFMGWYVEGMMQMGGLGLLGDIVYSVATQLDNGSYGEVRIGSTFLGPSFGAGISAVKVAAGATDSNEDSNAKERAAAREVATRIPVLGGIRSFREGVVDRVAGESSREASNNPFQIEGADRLDNPFEI